MKTYLSISVLSLILALYACERSIMYPPPLVCDTEDYELMQKPKNENPCELEYWEDTQFQEYQTHISNGKIDD